MDTSENLEENAYLIMNEGSQNKAPSQLSSLPPLFSSNTANCAGLYPDSGSRLCPIRAPAPYALLQIPFLIALLFSATREGELVYRDRTAELLAVQKLDDFQKLLVIM